jgi:hypothetical protein
MMLAVVGLAACAEHSVTTPVSRPSTPGTPSTPTDTGRSNPSRPVLVPVITMDTLPLYPGRKLWVRFGQPSNIGVEGVTWMVGDSTVLRADYPFFQSISVTAGRPGRTTLTARYDTMRVTREVIVEPYPARLATPLVAKAELLGGWDGDAETIRVAQLTVTRARDASPVTIERIIVSGADLSYADATCAGPPLTVLPGDSLTLSPTAFQYYNGYRTPLGGLPAMIRLFVREGGERWMVEVPVTTAAGTDGWLETTSTPGWTCA